MSDRDSLPANHDSPNHSPMDQADDLPDLLLRTAIEDFNVLSEDFDNVYRHVIRLTTSLSDDSLQIEHDDRAFAPGLWTMFVSDRLPQLLHLVHHARELARLASTGNQFAGETLLPTLHLPLASYDATDAAMIHYPQMREILGLFNSVRAFQIIFIDIIVSAEAMRESPAIEAGSLAFLQTLPRTPVNALMMADGRIECPICKEDLVLGELITVLPLCNHRYHFECIMMANRDTCPYCRRSIVL